MSFTLLGWLFACFASSRAEPMATSTTRTRAGRRVILDAPQDRADRIGGPRRPSASIASTAKLTVRVADSGACALTRRAEPSAKRVRWAREVARVEVESKKTKNVYVKRGEIFFKTSKQAALKHLDALDRAAGAEAPGRTGA